MKLGLSNIVPKRKSRDLRWSILYNDDKFGDVFKEYNKFLKAAHTSSNKSTTSRYISTTGTALQYLLDFINESNYEDFTVFNSPSVYEDFIEFLEQFMAPQSVRSYIPRVRHFIDTNIRKKYFPNFSPRTRMRASI